MPSAKIVKDSRNDIKLAKTPYAELAKIVPPIVNKIVEIQLSDTNYPLANAIRRTLMSEMPIRYLTVSLTDIISNDPFIVKNHMAKQLEMLPLNQDIDLDSEFAIRVENTTDDLMDVLSNDIKINGVTVSDDIMPMIPICNINSGKSFSMNNIRVATGYGFDNARIVFGRIGYEVLDHDMTQSSGNSSPTKFKLVLEFPEITNPVDMFKKALKCIEQRLDAIDYTRAISEFDVYKLLILNETHSIGNLLNWYINEINPSIDHVSYRITHPSKRECMIDIRDPAAEELCKKAIVAIKKDLAELAKL